MNRLLILFPILLLTSAIATPEPQILLNAETTRNPYLPDFSYAGYQNGANGLPRFQPDVRLDARDFGAVPDDGLDDSAALLKALQAAGDVDGSVLIQLPPGRLILSEILFIERSNLVLRGAGSGPDGTTIYCPRPMIYLEDPEPLQELREYLVEMDKRQREPRNNIDLPYSQYSWSGGMIWTHVPGSRVKSYLPRYAQEPRKLARMSSGNRGERTIVVESAASLQVGDVVQLEWYNAEGPDGSLLAELYPAGGLKVGSHHWESPDEPLVKQQVRIETIEDNLVTLSAPLLLDIREVWKPAITEWNYLENVGIEHLRFEFPTSPTIAHHVEQGYNAVYLTRLFDGWVKDLVIHNADTGIFTEESANLTIRDIITTGENLAHYSVYIGGVHNVLVEKLEIRNRIRHPLSFNTLATRNVYKDCVVYEAPILDQHSGANHQNLFDNITAYVKLNGKRSYPLFKGGGAGYWKPTHGAYSTFWNIYVHFLDGHDSSEPVILNGMNDGPAARIIGVHGNLPIEIDYGPNAWIELTNESMGAIPSLYDFQLQERKKAP